jgi:NADPH:quinone reductase-like Zn-dependent oxidoreductase
MNACSSNAICGTTMTAAVVTGFDRPLSMVDLPVPAPGPEQVLVRIDASGLCRTDIHAARGEWPVRPSPPFIPGHEGVIEALGPANASAWPRARASRFRGNSPSPPRERRHSRTMTTIRTAGDDLCLRGRRSRAATLG